MAGSASVMDSASLVEGMSSGNHCIPDESLMEYRSCGQVENGTPSTSPPYWDTDEDDDDCGLKPSALFGKFNWKIENFSQLNKRELRSNAFEVDGYKWYILIYPQGCDVCNHLSLFLCVANHDKLLPGWSHFAQFTIAVVNKDPKKSKYSDTLHRFWKKEHDWGWKKFMELSKVLDGFINDESLVIKAQVQVIREKTHRLFRCLDCQYRRELVRVYMSNVDQICRRFIEERKGKLSKLVEDKIKWSSFRAFWLGTDQIDRKHMSRDKTDAILKVVVKHFFVEKEVTSTLVMDSLYSGLKVLEYQSKSKSKRGRMKLVEMEEFPAPMVHIENDTFVLADDVLQLLEKVALGPTPLQPSTPKDDKSSQNRAKDGSSGDEFNRDSIERVERRLTEFGLRVLEFFVIAHIFSSKIEVAYQEAVALKRQEELIREEEAAEQAEIELKAKRNAAEKERRNKKKQAKQRKNSRKVKDREKDEKPDMMMHEKQQQQSPTTETSLEHFSCREVVILDKYVTSENASDTSDTGDAVSEIIQPDLEERECNFVSWETDASEIHPCTENSNCQTVNGQTEKKAACVMDDSSSTCSADSVASVVMTGSSYKGNSLVHSRNLALPKIRKKQQCNDTQSRPCDVRNLRRASVSSRASRAEPEAVVSLNDRTQWLEHLVDKEETTLIQKKLNVNNQADSEQPSNSSTVETSSSIGSSGNLSSQQPKQFLENAATNAKPISISVQEVPVKVPTYYIAAPSSTLALHATRSPPISVSKSDAEKHLTSAKSSTTQPALSISRPSSAPLIPPPRPTVPSVSVVQTSPFLSRSASATGRLGTDPSPSAPSFVPQSYRNAITGRNDPFVGPSTQPFVSSTAAPPPQLASRPRLTFGSMRPRDDPEPSCSGTSGLYSKQLDINSDSRAKKQHPSIRSFPQGTVGEEFPHLDIINDLLDEDKGIGTRAANLHCDHGPLIFNRQYSFPSDMDVGSFSTQMQFDPIEQYYDERAYGYSSGLRDGPYSPVDLAAYANGPFEGLSLNQWPYSATDLSMLSSGGTGGVGGYSYQHANYSSGLNAHMYSHPGNGRL